jgi:TupA-like ATPgrasp
MGGRSLCKSIQIERRNTNGSSINRDWVRQPFPLEYLFETQDVERPEDFSEMRQAAEKIGREFTFVRVDFCDLESRPKFGEITFAPDSGFGRFNPITYDLTFRRLWK